MIRRECGRCGAEVRADKRRHFCGVPYPLKATDDIRTVRYVPLAEVLEWLSVRLEGQHLDGFKRRFGGGER